MATDELVWRKSSYSGGNGECVEVAVVSRVLVRDSKNPSGPTLAFDQPTWRTFLTSGN